MGHRLNYARNIVIYCQEFNGTDAKSLKAPSWQRHKKHNKVVGDLTETIITLDPALCRTGPTKDE